MRFLRRGDRNQSLGLITIGLVMLFGSNLAEQAISNWITREVVQILMILIGILATTVLFRRKKPDAHRD